MGGIEMQGESTLERKNPETSLNEKENNNNPSNEAKEAKVIDYIGLFSVYLIAGFPLAIFLGFVLTLLIYNFGVIFLNKEFLLSNSYLGLYLLFYFLIPLSWLILSAGIVYLLFKFSKDTYYAKVITTRNNKIIASASIIVITVVLAAFMILAFTGIEL